MELPRPAPEKVSVNARTPENERVAETETQLSEAKRKIDELIEKLGAKNEELRIQAIQAQAVQRGKDEFLAAISHELRTPLNGVLGMVELLLGSPLDSNQRKWAGIIQDCGKSLLGIIGELLDVASIKSGRFRLEPTEFNLSDRMEQLAGTLEADARGKGMAYSWSVENGMPAELYGDARRLVQVLEILAGNAIKFSDSGEVKVRACLQEEDANGVVLRFAVQDSGPGISRENLDKIFELFSQEDGTLTKRHGGAGLGLSIAADLVRLMGGTLRVDSEVGVGSVFSFSARFMRAGDAAARPLAAKAAGGIVVRVLAVVESDLERKVIESSLRGWGLRAEGAADAEDAFRQIMGACAQNDPFRVIVVDRLLGGHARGKTLFNAIEMDQRANGTRIVWLEDGVGGPVDEGENMVVLSRPLDIGGLHRAMEKLLGIAAKGGHLPEGGPAAAPRVNRQGAVVLAIEPEMVSQMVLKAFLDKLGVGCKFAESKEEAERMLLGGGFHAVLAGMDRWTRYDLPATALPVAIMTPGEGEEFADKGTAILAKPLDLWRLADTLNQLL